MKVKKKLAVSPIEFYHVLYDSLKDEIELTLNRPIPKLYQGFKYEKELVTYAKNKRVAQIEITQLKTNELYEAVFKSGKDTNTIRFTITPNGDGSIVMYEEGYSNESGVRRTNYSIMSFILTPFNNRRAKKKLKAMEKYIVSNR